MALKTSTGIDYIIPQDLYGLLNTRRHLDCILPWSRQERNSECEDGIFHADRTAAVNIHYRHDNSHCGAWRSGRVYDARVTHFQFHSLLMGPNGAVFQIPRHGTEYAVLQA